MNWKRIKLKNRAIYYTFGIILSIILIVVVFFTVPWITLYVGLHSLPSPPPPEILYGEFPFRLEYEMNGRRIVVKDTLICEYDGVGVNTGSGKYHKWKEYLASGNERVTLLKISDTKEIYYPVGYAKYYMGYNSSGVTYEHAFPNANLLVTSGNTTHISTISAEELLNKYNIKLISWDYTEPIKQKHVKTK